MFTSLSLRYLSLGLLLLLLPGGSVVGDDKAPPLATKDQEKLQALLKERRDQLQRELDIRMSRVKAGTAVVDLYYVDASRALLAAELELTDKRKERIALHENHVELAKDREKIAETMAKLGRGDTAFYPQAMAARCEAELGLLREQAGDKPSAKQAEEIKKLLGERRDALSEALRIMDARIKGGTMVLHGTCFELSQQLMRVEFELADNPKERIAAREEFVKRAKDGEKIAETVVEKQSSGRGDPATYPQATAARCEAEVGLLRERCGDKPTAEQTTEMKKLLDERCDALREECEIHFKQLQGGTRVVDANILDGLRHLLQAELEVADKSEQRISVFEKRLKEVQECEKIAEARATAAGGRGDPASYPQAKAARLEVEIGLLRERMKASAPKK